MRINHGILGTLKISWLRYIYIYACRIEIWLNQSKLRTSTCFVRFCSMPLTLLGIVQLQRFRRPKLHRPNCMLKHELWNISICQNL
jgi:hypothetical protein